MSAAKRIQELIDLRAKAIADARAIADKAAEGDSPRAVTPEERTQIDRLLSEEKKHKEEQAECQRRLDLEREQKAIDDEKRALAESAGRKVGPETGAPGAKDEAAEVEQRKQQREGFGAYLSRAREGVSEQESRSLQALNYSTGGGVVVPLEVAQEVWRLADNVVFMRGKATMRQVRQTVSLGIPTVTGRADAAAWTSEIGDTAEDASLKFGRRELTPHKLASFIKMSNMFLRMAVGGAVEIVQAEIAYDAGIKCENAYLNGTGASQPAGLFTTVDGGLSTARDYSTDNTTTALTRDNIIGAYYFLKPQYRRTAEWIFHRDVMKLVALMKDGEGRYMFQSSMTEGQPDRLMGAPINESEYAPSTMTAGLYVGLFGDLKNYVIADSMQMEVQRILEYYFKTDESAIVARLWTDGQVMREEGFVRLKLAP
mgnify:CR=1 FL=1